MEIASFAAAVSVSVAQAPPSGGDAGGSSDLEDEPDFSTKADAIDDATHPEGYPCDNSDSYPAGLVSAPGVERINHEWPENRRITSEQIFILVQLEIGNVVDLDDLIERVRRNIVMICGLFRKGTRTIESGHMSNALAQLADIKKARVLVGTQHRPHGHQIVLNPVQLADFSKDRIDVDFGTFDGQGHFNKFVPQHV